MQVEVAMKLISDKDLQADCEQCFGLCCVALPYAKSSDFAFQKAAGVPCRNLEDDFRCSIHKELRTKGFRGCSVYECFGAGQKVAKQTYSNKNWRDHEEIAQEMFEVFPIMQQLHEILYYLKEAMDREETASLHADIEKAFHSIEDLTYLSPAALLELDIQHHRSQINPLLVQTSEVIRAKHTRKHRKLPKELIGANLSNKAIQGVPLRGALLIATDFNNTDLRGADFLGADLRDANLSGADLRECIFLTQAQLNAAKGDSETKLPLHLRHPAHWS